jgi:hypothetical protein
MSTSLLFACPPIHKYAHLLHVTTRHVATYLRAERPLRNLGQESPGIALQGFQEYPLGRDLAQHLPICREVARRAGLAGWGNSTTHQPAGHAYRAGQGERLVENAYPYPAPLSSDGARACLSSGSVLRQVDVLCSDRAVPRSDRLLEAR